MSVFQKKLRRNFITQTCFLCPLIGKKRRDVLHAKSAARPGPDASKQGDVVAAGAALRPPLHDLPEKSQLRVPFLAPTLKPLFIARRAARLRVPLARLL